MEAIIDGALKHVEPLAVHIGSRPIGSPAKLEEANITGRIPLFYGYPAQYKLSAKGEIYISDHYIFYSNGTPSIASTSSGIRDLYHNQSHTFTWIGALKLAETTRLTLDLIEVLDTKDLSWSRPKQET